LSLPEEQASDGVDIKFHGDSFEWAFPPVPKANEFEPVFSNTTSNHRADNRIKAWAISATSENSNAHVPHLSPSGPESMDHMLEQSNVNAIRDELEN